eukprot:CAMPEP_0173070614 /NCGR_PEP_ID=MMETSP1102-20130122/8726_1 /TAXON_ID=49646 /ORGANISM="Geminigera sp., Strain Caron Lab Isolate" /LENGTH=108 /DNA_ID=CAMNT_0013938925 /DNA_START=189 /DNA_END=515 /DNA_ORIENTATION=+
MFPPFATSAGAGRSGDSPRAKCTRGHVLELLTSLKACHDNLQQVDVAMCARACRGQMRQDDGHADGMVSELDEMRCTLAGVYACTQAMSVSHFSTVLLFVCVRVCVFV